MASSGGPLGWTIFGVVVAVMLALDLGIFHRKAHVVRAREALVWSLVWIGLALLFNLGIYLRMGADHGLEFFQAWLIEKALSVDNLFVFLAAFSFFAVPEELQHRVLFWGILGALVTRGIFIALGAALLAAFHWVTYIFGVFLVITGGRLLFGGDEEIHPEKNPVLGLFGRLIPTTSDYDGPHFVVRRDGRLMATPLLMVLVVIEASDVVFAVDSIPAVFGVTRDVFIVYTSNIFAVLGLRALCFLVAQLVRRLRYLKTALALVLAFVGGKMLIADRYHISDTVSLAVVGGLIGIAAILSLIIPPKKKAA
ncbi:MAG TPA: TerC family protein [Polyangia bacterium]|nr:TerC family protein [Polyangia bacterium]HVZ86747.1 TerC family protein [Polyangia bacterium]